MKFVDLHRHSEYSLLDGSIKIKDMVENTPHAGAITDHGNLFGHLKYYKMMKEAGKVPIIGMEGYMETIDGKLERNHVILLCKDLTGYRNLSKLTTLSYQKENFYRKPHIRWADLRKYHEGLICSSACLGGEIPKKIAKGQIAEAEKVVLAFRDIFQDDFYLEIQRHFIPTEKEVNEQLIRMSKKYNIKLIATTDAHYLKKEDKKIHDILLAMQTKTTMSNPKRFKLSGQNHYLLTEDEMLKLFKDIPEAVTNTVEVYEKCKDFEMDIGNIYMPKVDIPEGYDDETHYFKSLLWQGCKEKGFDKKKEYIDRLKKEVDVIVGMNFVGYFLIVADFINYAKNNGIAVGPGRGSAGGSLVSYLLGITEIDPLKYGLIFERFLNPDRVSMPDIDVDISDIDRERVLDYVRGKYGEENVSNIITFGTLGAKMAIRDVARTLDYKYEVGDRLAKLIPAKPGITLDEAINEVPELRYVIENESRSREIIEIARKVEGLPKNCSVHACGVCISDRPVVEHIPESTVGDDKNGKVRVTQVTMTECEELGLLKIDFLGLRTMGVIQKTIEAINKKYNKNLTVNSIPINDVNSYRIIASGETDGLFQIENAGMREFMQQLYSDLKFKKQYNSDYGDELFGRLVAGISLYRPGPLDYIPDYLEGMKHKNVKYEDERLRPILEETYGQIVYQEQVMRLAVDLAGYSMSKADTLRKAMGKKKKDLMLKEREIFIYGDKNTLGCVNNGIPENTAIAIWDKMEKFCQYAFNKSHSTGYAIIAAKTAYLKTYYPLEFMAEVCNSYLSKQDQLNEKIKAVKKMGIKFKNPNINESTLFFTAKNNQIYFGLFGLKNVGKSAYTILEERKNGKFTDFYDFLKRCDMNKREVESLIFAGAFDDFNISRKGLKTVLPALLKSAKKARESKLSGQLNFFGDSINEYIYMGEDIAEYEELTLLKKERDVSGIFISKHPVESYVKDLYCPRTLISDFENVSFMRIKNNYVFGLIEEVRYFTTRNGGTVISFDISDETGEINCVYFVDNFSVNNFRNFIYEDNLVYLKGKYKTGKYGKQIVVDYLNEIKTKKIA